MKGKRLLVSAILLVLIVGVLILVGYELDPKSERVGLEGEVRPWTFALAKNYFKATWLSNAESQYLMGRYEIDWNQDGDAALSWFRRAASAGNANAIEMVKLQEKKN